MPESRAASSPSSLQDLQQALLEAKQDQRPDRLQNIVRSSSGSDLLQLRGEELLDDVLCLCNATEESSRKLPVLNISWKALLTILSSPKMSPSNFLRGLSFMLDQLEWGTLSHDWTDPKKIRLVAFIASHVVPAIRTRPLLVANDPSYKSVDKIMKLSLSVAVTIATSARDEASLWPMYDGVLVRMGAILQCLGDACLTDPVADEEGEAAAAPAQHAVVWCLLQQCLPEATAAQVEEAAGRSEGVAESISTTMFSCFLRVTKGLLGSSRVSSLSRPNRLMLLRALLCWLPGARDVDIVYSDEQFCASSERDEAAGAALLLSIGRAAELLPAGVLHPATHSGAVAAKDVEDEGSLREQWLENMAMSLHLLWESHPDKSPLSRASPVILLISTLCVPCTRVAGLVMEAWNRWCQREWYATARGREEHAQLLRELLYVGAAAVAQARRRWGPIVDSPVQQANFFRWWSVEWLNALAALVGASCAQHVGQPPWALLQSEVTPLKEWDPLAIFVHLAGIAYHFVSNAATAAEGDINEGDACELPQSLHELEEIVKEVDQISQGLKELDERFDDCNAVKLAHGVLRVPLCLKRIRTQVLGKQCDSYLESDDAAGKFHSALSTVAASLSTVTKVLQWMLTSNSETSVWRRLVHSALVALVREAAYFSLEVNRDALLLACVRRWVDLSFASQSSATEGQQAIAPLAEEAYQRFQAACSLLHFAQLNTCVSMDDMHLSEAAVISLMEVLQTTPSDGEVPPGATVNEPDDPFYAASSASLLDVWRDTLHQYVAESASACLLPIAHALSDESAVAVSDIVDELHRCQLSLNCLLQRLAHHDEDNCREHIENSRASSNCLPQREVLQSHLGAVMRLAERAMGYLQEEPASVADEVGTTGDTTTRLASPLHGAPNATPEDVVHVD